MADRVRPDVTVIANRSACEQVAGLLGRARAVVVERLEEAADREHRVVVLAAEQPEDVQALASTAAASPLERAVVVVVEQADRRCVRNLLAVGAAAVLALDALERTLEPCLAAVGGGLVCVPREQWRQVEPPVLSSREKQILGLVVMGYMNSQIAEELFLAESTVKSHLHSAFGKLGVRSRHEAVSMILDPHHGLGLGILGVGAEPVAVESEPLS